MKTKINLFVAIVFFALGTWFYFTPHLTVSRMKAAAEAKDGTQLSGYVDFPALKESFKVLFSEKIASEAAKENAKGNKIDAALSAALVKNFIHPMIDALVTPENLAKILKGEKLHPVENAEQPKSSDSGVDTSMFYESFDRFVVRVKKKDSTEDPLYLILHREGLLSWRLSALRW